MEKIRKFIRAAFFAAAAVTAATSCEGLFGTAPQGSIEISFSEEMVSLLRTASDSEIPDTNDFILTVTDSKGNVAYSGKYGAAPSTLMASPGSYTVSVRSAEFTEPKFSSPQFGDDCTVVVTSGSAAKVSLNCTQVNSGVKLEIASAFLTEYPQGVLYLKSSDGRLMYSYSEKRIAYFNPGSVSLILVQGTDEKTLFTRTLAAREILVMGISVTASSSGGSGMSIVVDTTRNWISDGYTLGGSSSGAGDIKNAYAVGEVEDHAGEEDVWVYGYIVGGNLSSSRCSFTPPFSSRTNLVLAAKSSCTDKEQCVSVQLAKGDIRDALNLVDHQEYLGRQIYVKGDIVTSYYGIPGVQNLSEYKFK